MSPGASGAEYERSDYGNARYLQNLCNGTLLYDHTRGSWFFWEDGKWWRDEKDYARMRAMQVTVNRMAGAYNLPPEQWSREAAWAAKGQSAGGVHSLLELAKAFPDMQAPEWDSDPMLTGFSNGLVELSTGRFRKQIQADPVLFKASVEYKADAKCPRWDKFLGEVLPNKDYVDFVQKAVGYSLTGHTTEQCFFYLIGEGSNGKTTFQAVLEWLMGEYHANTPFATFIKRRDHQSTNDLAVLLGKRVVSASEASGYETWDEVKLKSITGSDPITCRFLYHEFFTYKPQFKIWAAANALVRTQDFTPAFWRRVRLIPFPNTFIPGGEPNLWGKLRAELPGILNWAIEGCLKWQKEGLKMPDEMVKEVQDYRETQVLDSPGGVPIFLMDRTQSDSSTRTSATSLYRAYREWAESLGYLERDILSQNAFGRQVSGSGIKKVKMPNGFVYEVKILDKKISTEKP